MAFASSAMAPTAAYHSILPVAFHNFQSAFILDDDQIGQAFLVSAASESECHYKWLHQSWNSLHRGSQGLPSSSVAPAKFR